MMQPLLDHEPRQAGLASRAIHHALCVDDRGLAHPNRLVDHAKLLGKLTLANRNVFFLNFASQYRLAKGFRRTLVFRDDHQPAGFAIEAVDHPRRWHPMLPQPFRK